MTINLNGLGISSYPVSIGDILEDLNLFNEDLKVYLSDGSSLKNSYHNYRGDYSALSLSYCFDSSKETITVKELKDLLNKALEDKTMNGCRGGEFEIELYTEIYISMEDCSGTPIVGMINHKNNIYLLMYEKY